MSVLLLIVCNFDVLDITPSKDYVFEFLLRGWDETCAFFAVFCSKGVHIFERNGGLLRVDLMKYPDVAVEVSAKGRPCKPEIR